MVKRKPYHTRLYRTLLCTVWCAALLTPVVVVTAPQTWKKLGANASLLVSGNGSFLSNLTHNASSFGQEGLLPSILSQTDVELYQATNRAQKQADWLTADAAMAQIKNKLLVGYMLGERFLDRRYEASPHELSEWLNRYSDHPQAAEIYARAMIKAPYLKQDVPLVRRQAVLESYGDDNGLGNAHIEESPYARTWHAGLQAWKFGRKDEAARYFATLTEHKDAMSPWIASACAYWAYRSYDAIGNHALAGVYLHMAADHPRSFYGILARKQLKAPLELDTSPVKLTDSDILQMVGDQSIRRTVALSQAGFPDLAEKELRLRFPQAEDDEKQRLLALAHELGLASVQISMAKQMGANGHALDFARYPIPNVAPTGGFRVDPLLLFSLMRQESGFRASAVSSGGALGLMQLMPQTASLMQRQMGDNAPVDILADKALGNREPGNFFEPIVNVTLGQNYVEHLLNDKLVGDNLFYLLAAYNAGPGRLQEWKGTIAYNNDPLLFVESIPYAQTRNYVMQVMTNYWIYSELSGNSNRSAYAVAQGHWPAYDQYQGPLAAKTAGTAASPDGV